MPDDPIPILHLDDDLVVVSKPPGLVVHRDQWSGRDELPVLQRVSAQTGAYIYPVHRLDRNTSGVLAFALSREMAAALSARLAEPETRKEYLVLCRGETPEAFVSDRPLKNTRKEEIPAHSEFRRLAAFSRCSLLEVRITTGRHHQIRRHLGHLAHQVIGDSSHGKGRINRFFRDTWGLPRMFMHARRLILAHPRTGAVLEIVDPLAADLRAFLSRLPDIPPRLVDDL